MKKSSGQNNHRYDDIIHLPHHVSTVHMPMPVAERAAQFSPFAALTGFEDAIRETGRLTDSRAELEEDARAFLDEKLERLQMLQLPGGEPPEVAVTYFQPDERKDGGAYVTVTGRLKRVDVCERMLIFKGGERIGMDDIVEIEEV